VAETVERYHAVVEAVDGSRLRLKTIQYGACGACALKGKCSSPESAERFVDATAAPGDTYKVGDEVWLVASKGMGFTALLYGVIIPFLIVFVSIFLFQALWHNEPLSGLCALALLVPYYLLLALNKGRMQRKLTFTVRHLAESGGTLLESGELRVES